jgi:hypothetical protein
MPFQAALRIAHDGFAKAGERHRLDRHAGFLANLACHGFRQGLAGLDHASGQAEQIAKRDR